MSPVFSSKYLKSKNVLCLRNVQTEKYPNVSIEIHMALFTAVGKPFLKCMWNQQTPTISKESYRTRKL